METISIIADNTKRFNNTTLLARQNPQFNLQISHLNLGDYRIDNWLIIEHIAINKMVQLLISGSLFKLASRLSKAQIKVAILIEGCTRDIESYNIHRNTILGALVTLSIFYGIPILRSANAQDSLSVMKFAATQKSKWKGIEFQIPGYKPKTIKGRQLFILQGLPGVGPTLAKRLLAHCGSVKEVFNADIDALCEVEGIGVEKAKKMLEVLSAL